MISTATQALPSRPSDPELGPASDPALRPTSDPALGPPREPAGDDTPPPSGPQPRRWLWPLQLTAEAVGVYALLHWLTVMKIRTMQLGTDTFYGGVLTAYFGPEKHATARFFDDGFLPTWVRSQFAGEPYIANLQHAVFYPGNFPFWVLPTSNALKVVVAGHLAFAGVAMWAYCRIALRTGLAGATVAALGFGLGGFTLAHFGLMNQLQTVAWMPLVLLGGHLVLERGKLRHVVLAAVFIGVQFLAGHPEEWVYTLYALALYGVVWALARAWPWPGREAWLRRTGGGALKLGSSVALFALLFGFQLFPTVLLRSQGYRSEPGFSTQYDLPDYLTINSLLPDYGTVLNGENAGFVGVAALVLAAFGVVAGRRDLRWVRIWLGVLAVGGVVMAVGTRSPLYRFLWEHVDLVSDFRVPARWLQLTTFAMAAGAAVGTDALLRRDVAKPLLRLLHVALAAVAVAVLYGVASRFGHLTDPAESWRWWALAAGIVVFCWLVASAGVVPRFLLGLILVVTAAVEVSEARPNAEYNESIPGMVYDDPGPLLPAISPPVSGENGRYVTVARRPQTPNERGSYEVPAALDQRQHNYFLHAMGSQQLIARPGINYMTGAETITGRDGGLVPTQRYLEFLRAATRFEGPFFSGSIPEPPSNWTWPTLDFLGIRWFVTGTVVSDEELARLAEVYTDGEPGALSQAEAQVLTEHGFQTNEQIAHVLLWSRPEPPLARMHYDTIDVIGNADERLRRLAEDYPLTGRAIVEEPAGPFTPPATPPTVETTIDQAQVDVKVTTETDGLLALADPWYPGWKVEIDGEPAELLRVNHTFRGVVVPSGAHDVTFTYTDPSMRAGFATSVATLLALVGAAMVIAERRRQNTVAS